jgi:hypothetical protein
LEFLFLESNIRRERESIVASAIIIAATMSAARADVQCRTEYDSIGAGVSWTECRGVPDYQSPSYQDYRSPNRRPREYKMDTMSNEEIAATIYGLIADVLDDVHELEMKIMNEIDALPEHVGTHEARRLIERGFGAMIDRLEKLNVELHTNLTSLDVDFDFKGEIARLCEMKAHMLRELISN